MHQFSAVPGESLPLALVPCPCLQAKSPQRHPERVGDGRNVKANLMAGQERRRGVVGEEHQLLFNTIFHLATRSGSLHAGDAALRSHFRAVSRRSVDSALARGARLWRSHAARVPNSAAPDKEGVALKLCLPKNRRHCKHVCRFIGTSAAAWHLRCSAKPP